MYIGFSQIPIFIGWSLEGKLGPMLYGIYASKEKFSRELLLERGMPQAEVEAIKKGEAFDVLMKFTGESADSLTHTLHATHNVGLVWLIMAIVGGLTAVGIHLYGRWVRTLAEQARAAK